jgi:hypothetical protein
MAAHQPATPTTKTALKRELAETLHDLFTESLTGKPTARQWLLQSFPGHKKFLMEVWTQQQAATPERAGQ